MPSGTFRLFLAPAPAKGGRGASSKARRPRAGSAYAGRPTRSTEVTASTTCLHASTVSVAHFSDDQVGAGGEQLAGPRIARAPQRATGECPVVEGDRGGVTVGIAGDLAQDACIAATAVDLEIDGVSTSIPADRVYVMIGGELPLQFLTALGVAVDVKFGTA
jgi:hypothetical protein